MPDGSVFLSDPFLKIAEVCREVGLSRSSIYRRIEQGTFPPPRRIGCGQIRWPASVIRQWKEATVSDVPR